MIRSQKPLHNTNTRPSHNAGTRCVGTDWPISDGTKKKYQLRAGPIIDGSKSVCPVYGPVLDTRQQPAGNVGPGACTKRLTVCRQQPACNVGPGA